MARTDRRAAERRGRHSEWLVAVWLTLKGYRIMEIRARTPAGEIDLVCRKGRLLVMVEVKQRAGLADAAHAVSLRAQARILRASEAWCRGRYARFAGYDRRFDLVAVSPRGRIRHLRDAWRPEF